MSPKYLQDVFKTCLQDISKICLQDMSSRHLQDMSSRRLQRNNVTSSNTSPRRLQDVLQDVFKTSLQDVFKTSSRRLGRRKIVTLKTSSRHVLKTPWRSLQDQQMFTGWLLGNSHRRCSIKKAVLKFVQYLQENNCVGVLSNKVAGLQVYWKETPTLVFSFAC